jgi:hypothetical protein
MATLKIDSIKCIRKQDVTGSDEPVLYIGGLKVWDGKMNNDDSRTLNVSRGFTDNVLVELKEVNGKSEKSLGKWTVSDTPTANGNPPLTATSSGYHYQVYFDVAA